MSVSQVEHALKHILEERADVLAFETHEAPCLVRQEHGASWVNHLSF
ncbi:MAG: hypothetical protein ACXVDN_11400 [Ktedonobacteraceae bacterium]